MRFPGTDTNMQNPFYADHYAPEGGAECIDLIEAMLSPEERAGFLKGCAVKYLFRDGAKELGSKPKDRYKAADYACRLATGRWLADYVYFQASKIDSAAPESDSKAHSSAPTNTEPEIKKPPLRIDLSKFEVVDTPFKVDLR